MEPKYTFTEIQVVFMHKKAKCHFNIAKIEKY